MVAQDKVQEQAELEISGDVIASDVSLEDYLEHYAADHCEWVEGWVIKMAPATLKHNEILYYLYTLLRSYFKINAIGRVVGQPFVVRLPEFPNRRREPDLIVVFNESSTEIAETFVNGAPDICIEIVSEESTARDHGEKFAEYEAGGVPEYWIIDPVRQATHFYRLNEQKRYVRQETGTDGVYRSPALPGLALHIPTLWQDDLPDPVQTVEAVKAMLAG